MDIPYLRAMTETDKDEVGKGNEFITQVFKTSKEPAQQRIEKYGSAEFTLWAWGYGMGRVGLATGLYTIHPTDPGTTIENPYFSVVAQLAAGGGNAIDEAHVGCSVESVETVFKYGPTRASLRTTVDYVGSGISTLPSGVSVPAVLAEDYMMSSSMAISINGVDYVSEKMALQGSMGWRNNSILPMRYFPGSGLDSDGFAIGGRTFFGNRVPTLSFTVFLDNNSLEYAKLVAQTSGTATLTATFDATHFVTWTYNNVSFELVEKTQEEGLVAVTVTVAPKYDATVVGGIANNVLIVTGKCGIADICQ
jgi:hypothetical protein